MPYWICLEIKEVDQELFKGVYETRWNRTLDIRKQLQEVDQEPRREHMSIVLIRYALKA